jgi:replicative DNA helicase
MALNYKIPVAMFSLEMSNVQLVNRLLQNVCEIPGDKIKSGRLSQEEWNQLNSRVAQLYGCPIIVDDTPSLSVFELRTKARRLVKEKGVKCIMIDYLQLMNASGMQFGSREQEVSTISRSLKGLAKELNIPIIALSQLNRSVESRQGDGKRPQLSDLRESGAIEQDADMVCFIHRPEYYKVFEDEKGNDLRGLAEIIIAKHRNGAVGDVRLRFRGEFVRFQNMDDETAVDLHDPNIPVMMGSSPAEPSTPGVQTLGSRMNAAYPETPAMQGPGLQGPGLQGPALQGPDTTAQFLTQKGGDADMPF